MLSLDPQSKTENADEWRSDTQRRAADLDNDLATLIPAEVVRAAAQPLLEWYIRFTRRRRGELGQED